MKISAMCAEDIRHVIDNLWDRGRVELGILKLSQKDLADIFLSMVGKPFTASFLDDEGNPCAIIALELLGKNHWRTHFAASETGFLKIAFPLTRFLAQFSKDLVNNSMGKIEILSAFLPEDAAGRWFRAIGFLYDGQDKSLHRYLKKAV